MKTIYIALSFTLLFCANITGQTSTENSGGDMFNGMKNTLDNLKSKGNEALRLWRVLNQDIVMELNAEFEEDTEHIWYYSGAHEGSIHGEYDADNRALSMHLTGSEYKTGIKASGLTKISKAQDHYQFTDIDGYWYVPYDDPNGQYDYVKFHAKQTVVSALQELIDIAAMINAENLATTAEEIFGQLDSEFLKYLSNNKFDQLIIAINKNLAALSKASQVELKKMIHDILKERYTEQLGLPVFIHWALIYSPNLVKKEKNVSETSLTYRGLPNCTKLTVLSGKDKGKSMIFDPYDRLVYINALKEGTVAYYYDRDVTVTLPPALTMSNIMGNIEKEKQKEANMWENYRKKKEREKLAKEQANQKEIKALREQELKELMEKEENAITKDEKEEIQKRIQELKELMEKESNNGNQ